MTDDAARRCAEAVTVAALAGDTGRWLAVRLSDGSTDGSTYDTREAAHAHQLRPEHCAYLRVAPDGLSEREATAVLAYWRALHAAGFRETTPVFMPLIPLTSADQARQLRILAKGHR